MSREKNLSTVHTIYNLPDAEELTIREMSDDHAIRQCIKNLLRKNGISPVRQMKGPTGHKTHVFDTSQVKAILTPQEIARLNPPILEEPLQITTTSTPSPNNNRQRFPSLLKKRPFLSIALVLCLFMTIRATTQPDWRYILATQGPTGLLKYTFSNQDQSNLTRYITSHALYRSEHYVEAQKVAYDLIAENPDQEVLHNARYTIALVKNITGDTYTSTGYLLSALEWYRSKYLWKKAFTTALQLVNTYRFNKDYKKANEYLNLAYKFMTYGKFQSDPSFIATWKLKQGQLLYTIGQWENSRDTIIEAYSLFLQTGDTDRANIALFNSTIPSILLDDKNHAIDTLNKTQEWFKKSKRMKIFTEIIEAGINRTTPIKNENLREWLKMYKDPEISIVLEIIESHLSKETQ